MKFSLLLSAAQTRHEGSLFGASGLEALLETAKAMKEVGLEGRIFDLPCNARDLTQASPFSIRSGFALNPLELDLFTVPEILEQAEVLATLKELQALEQANFAQSPGLAYSFRATLYLWALRKAFGGGKLKGKRGKSYQEFQKAAAYWLEPYALFEARRQLKTLPAPTEPWQSSMTAQEEEESRFIVYQQFLCWEQRKKLKERLEEEQIPLVLNLPFGLERDSAEVALLSEVFDPSLQVGCGPEPYNGFPEQAWGIAPYQERSPALKEYLLRRIAWLGQFGHGVFLDHLVGWCGQYVLPLKLSANPGPQGHFLTSDAEERKANLLWFLEVLHQGKLSVLGEIAGDRERVAATQAGLAEAKKKGWEVTPTLIPRWEKDHAGRLRTLAEYDPQALVMIETHDTSTLLQYLANQKGGQADFEGLSQIEEFCHLVLGLPLFPHQLPLKPAVYSEEAVWEIYRRLVQGCPSQEVAFTLPGLISWLHPKWRSVSKKNNINVQAGTTGEVGNEEGNWSFFSPPLRAFKELKKGFAQLGPRVFAPMQPVYGLDLGPVRGLWSALENKTPLVLQEGKLIQTGVGADFEICLYNPQQQPMSGMLGLSFLPLQGEELQVRDAGASQKVWRHDLRRIRQEGLYYRLGPGQSQHLLLWN